MTKSDSICFVVSKITDTIIKRPVPPISKVVIWVNFWAREGITAIRPKNNAPNKVILKEM